VAILYKGLSVTRGHPALLPGGVAILYNAHLSAVACGEHLLVSKL